MRTRTKTRNFFAPRATGLGGAVKMPHALTRMRTAVTRAAVTLALVMLTTATAWAQAVKQEGDWYYTYDSGTNVLTITHYNGTDASVTTPTMLGGHAVTAIGAVCFNTNNSHTYMTSVTISEGITTIGDNAFKDCSNLASVSLPNSLTIIEHHAFKGCSALTTITIPSSVTEIGYFAFSYSGLTDLYFAGTKAQWNNVAVDTYAFDKISPTIHWRCTATFNMQGHGTAPAAQTVYSSIADALTVPTAPTATGYDFGGWYTDAACTSAFDFTAALDDNVTIYAKWTALENTIQFDLDNRGTAIDAQTVYSGNTVTEPAVQFDGTGGIEGWYTDAGRTVPYDFTTVVDHSFTLYAKWAAAGTATISVTNGEGGTATLTNAKGQDFNNGLVMPGNYTLTVMPNSGYSFSGQYTLTSRSGGTSDMPYTISGSSKKTYALNLTEKDAAISVRFSNQPTVSINVTDDGQATGYSYTLKDGQATPVDYTNGGNLAHVNDGSSEFWTTSYNLTLTITKGENMGCTGTITNNGVTTDITDDKTLYTIEPKGSIDIELYFYNKYTITTDGNCEVYYYDWLTPTVVTEAEEGKELSVKIKEDAQPDAGKYFTGEFKLNGTSLGMNEWSYPIVEFTMPAEAVTIEAVQDKRKSISFDLTATTRQEVPSAAALLFNGDERLNYNDELGGYDVDNSGVADMVYTTSEDGMHMYVQRLAGADAVGTTTLTYSGATDQYGTISFIFPEAPTAVDVTLADAADNASTLSSHNGELANVTLSGRTFDKSGSWNTLCLPFDVTTLTGTPLEGATIKELDTGETALNTTTGKLTLKFTAVSSIEAGRPYIVKWSGSGSLSNPVFEGVTISSTTPTEAVSSDGNVKFVGQYAPFAIDADNLNAILFVGSGNQIGYSKNARSLNCFRAHFWVKPNGSAQAARTISIDFGDSETTSIRLVDADGTSATTGIYTLDGRRLQAEPTQRGVYIKNGKKMVK